MKNASKYSLFELSIPNKCAYIDAQNEPLHECTCLCRFTTHKDLNWYAQLQRLG